MCLLPDISPSFGSFPSFVTCQPNVLYNFLCNKSRKNSVNWSYFLIGEWFSRISSCKALCICEEEWLTIQWLWCFQPLLTEFAIWRTNSGIPWTLCSLVLFFNNFIVFKKDFDVCFRQLLLRCKIFWFLVEKGILYSVHKKANCGDLHLWLHHNLVIRFFAYCTLLSLLYLGDFMF